MIPSVRFDEINTIDTYLYFTPNIWLPFFASCRLTNDSRKTKRFFSFCEINATEFGNKKCIPFGLYHAVVSNHTTLLLMFVAEKVLLLLVISLTVYWVGSIYHSLKQVYKLHIFNWCHILQNPAKQKSSGRVVATFVYRRDGLTRVRLIPPPSYLARGIYRGWDLIRLRLEFTWGLRYKHQEVTHFASRTDPNDPYQFFTKR